jgi:hypothetical protein
VSVVTDRQLHVHGDGHVGARGGGHVGATSLRAWKGGKPGAGRPLQRLASAKGVSRSVAQPSFCAIGDQNKVGATLALRYDLICMHACMCMHGDGGA